METRMLLPRGWNVIWGEPGTFEWLPEARLLRFRSPVSLPLWKRSTGVAAILAAARSGPLQIELPTFPSFDEIWGFYLLRTLAEARDWHPSWHAICQYAEDVRQGYWPDRIPPECAVQSLYLALMQAHLQRERPDREAFVDDVNSFLDVLTRKVEAGRGLLEFDFFRDEPAFVRYRQILLEDKKIYASDRERSTAFWAQVGPEEPPRKAALLVLRHPVAAEFKLWARRDETAPGGSFPLLVTELKKGEVVISADPVSRLRVGWLAGPLSQAEARKDGAAREWYDGRRHGETIVAAPREGTRLELDEVVDVLRQPLRLERIRPWPRKMRRVDGSRSVILGAAGLAATVLVAAFLLHPWSGTPSTISSRGAEPLAALPTSAQGPVVVGRRVALLVATDRYDDKAWPSFAGDEMKGDARELEEVLHRPEYGFETIPFYDGTRGDLYRKLSELAKSLREPDQLLFFAAGHGTDGELERRALVLRTATPDCSDGCYDFTSLSGELAKMPARHVLVVLDTCFSGAFGRTRGGPSHVQEGPEGPAKWVEDQLREKSRQYVTSGGDYRVPAQSRFLPRFRQILESPGDTLTVAKVVSELQGLSARSPGDAEPAWGSFDVKCRGDFILKWKGFRARKPGDASQTTGR